MKRSITQIGLYSAFAGSNSLIVIEESCPSENHPNIKFVYPGFGIHICGK